MKKPTKAKTTTNTKKTTNEEKVDYATAIDDGRCVWCGSKAVGLPDSHFLDHQQNQDAITPQHKSLVADIVGTPSAGFTTPVEPSASSGTPLPFAEASPVREIDHIKPLPKRQFTHEQLLEALYWMLLIFERASMTIVLIRSTGKAAHESKKLSGDGIYVAARQLEWDSGSRHVIDTLAQYSDITDNLITYVANNGVPVYVQVCEDDYCISSPDTKLYEHEYVKLPNPFARFEEVYG